MRSCLGEGGGGKWCTYFLHRLTLSTAHMHGDVWLHTEYKNIYHAMNCWYRKSLSQVYLRYLRFLVFRGVTFDQTEKNEQNSMYPFPNILHHHTFLVWCFDSRTIFVRQCLILRHPNPPWSSDKFPSIQRIVRELIIALGADVAHFKERHYFSKLVLESKRLTPNWRSWCNFTLNK